MKFETSQPTARGKHLSRQSPIDPSSKQAKVCSRYVKPNATVCPLRISICYQPCTSQCPLPRTVIAGLSSDCRRGKHRCCHDSTHEHLDKTWHFVTWDANAVKCHLNVRKRFKCRRQWRNEACCFFAVFQNGRRHVFHTVPR